MTSYLKKVLDLTKTKTEDAVKTGAEKAAKATTVVKSAFDACLTEIDDTDYSKVDKHLEEFEEKLQQISLDLQPASLNVDNLKQLHALKEDAKKSLVAAKEEINDLVRSKIKDYDNPKGRLNERKQKLDRQNEKLVGIEKHLKTTTGGVFALMTQQMDNEIKNIEKHVSEAKNLVNECRKIEGELKEAKQNLLSAKDEIDDFEKVTGELIPGLGKKMKAFETKIKQFDEKVGSIKEKAFNEEIKEIRDKIQEIKKRALNAHDIYKKSRMSEQFREMREDLNKAEIRLQEVTKMSTDLPSSDQMSNELNLKESDIKDVKSFIESKLTPVSCLCAIM